jgi:hypothetical protein
LENRTMSGYTRDIVREFRSDHGKTDALIYLAAEDNWRRTGLTRTCPAGAPLRPKRFKSAASAQRFKSAASAQRFRSVHAAGG